MKVLVFGRTGQVATELQRQLPQARFLGREQADLADPEACAAAIRDSDAEAVINAAAWTAVDKAETEEAAATVVNGAAPAAMARACAARGIPFLHVSTDYVFSGAGSAPWVETDPVAPQNAYGRSKLAGEQGVRAAGGAAAILRTSWVFSAHGANFVKTMLRLSESRDALNVVEDQIGGPTPAADIAAALIVMARKMAAGQPGGTYHFGGSPWVSWADFAREIFALAGRKVAVTGIPTAAYPTPALRPLNSRMDCAALARDFGIAAPDWQAGLSKVLKELEI
ncbi:dTDP-4-dehydrorhamnose reductase [Rhodobacter capsulatus]|uniref:dTDP-4-dehydrorhamnose reductase n=1 Tax=Rhodobacter capsulatus TaxID=1061 RepID=UPI0004CF1313|nr:dTDP-4-dehydrorhamnose reductase [Rhodobacter capsulatus]MDS0925534.1 dTDP-4-dehydrorhamnose reductase [Rhodobacter capsulatus]TQD34211.1 dTDP-4-dehydrorhamnose reductase [Rhodobacter capsulatus]